MYVYFRNALLFKSARLFIIFVSSFCLFLVQRGQGEDSDSKVLSGQGSSGDWQSDAPGVRHKITVTDLPKDFDTPSVDAGPKIVKRPEKADLHVPPGFKVDLYATGFKNPRFLLTAPNGDIFVSESQANMIRILRDTKGEGHPDVNEVFASGLDMPFGLAFYPPGPDPQYLYVANTGSIVRFPYHNGDMKAQDKPEHIADLSSGGRLRGGGHWTRAITFSLDGKRLFASIGSKSNVDEKHDPIENDRARILEFKPDGSDKKVFASGIRNAVGIQIHPETGELWMSTNERDGLGDDLVPDYIGHVQEGGFYGWPWYYIGNHQDPRQKGEHPEIAEKVLTPDVLVQSHSASLNLVFYTGNQFPKDYTNDVFAAFHGSWNRSKRTGYKIIRVPLDHGKAKGYYEDFLIGFVTEEGNVWGRPVGLTVMKDGSLLMSEDGGNTLWRIHYSEQLK
jgi:glucose/arabinose dehydrogenase